MSPLALTKSSRIDLTRTVRSGGSMAGMLSYRSCPRSESHTVRSLLDFSSSFTFFWYRWIWFKAQVVQNDFLYNHVFGWNQYFCSQKPPQDVLDWNMWKKATTAHWRQYIEVRSYLLFTINSQCLRERWSGRCVMTDAMLNEFKCWSRLTWRIYARLPETIYHPRRSLSMVKARGYDRDVAQRGTALRFCFMESYSPEGS